MNETFRGAYCSGTGDPAWLRLLDDSLSMLHPTPRLPNLSMLYNPNWDSLREGFIWGNGWWIQNSYGFALTAVPLLSEPWLSILGHGMDQFWQRIGDGSRSGADPGSEGESSRIGQLVAPDGALGDCVFGDMIIYKQGDGHFELYDWFYEATAAGVIMQAELLLRRHDAGEALRYLPLMKRSCDFIEGARAENGLFLVGPSCNLLAPSFGAAYDRESQTFKKSYLTGLSVTYSGALRRMIELFRLCGRAEDETLYRGRLDRTLRALPLLLTDEGYFVKSMEPDGTPHGVYGADRYGYLEGVCNVDAAALDAVTPEVLRSILDKLAAVPGIRPHELLVTNFPHLDDTYMNYQNDTSEPGQLGWHWGDWVDGGAWATVEGRAVLACLRGGRYNDAFRACARYMRWAEDYRQDAPMSQHGGNTHNPWQKEFNDGLGNPELRPVSVMIDNFAPVTALPRGLFEYRYAADSLAVVPHLPQEIRTYVQHAPVWFGDRQIRVSAVNGSSPPVLFLNGERLEGLEIPYGLLREQNDLRVVMGGGEIAPELLAPAEAGPRADLSVLPADLRDIAARCEEAAHSAEGSPVSGFAKEILRAAEAAALRRTLPFDRENFRPMTETKKAAILELYDSAVRSMYEGIKHYM